MTSASDEEAGLFSRQVAAGAEDHLEGDDAVELFLAGLVDDAHAAASDFGQDFVARHLGWRVVGRAAAEGVQCQGRPFFFDKGVVNERGVAGTQTGLGDGATHGANEEGRTVCPRRGVGQRPAVAAGAGQVRVHETEPWAGGGTSCGGSMAYFAGMRRRLRVGRVQAESRRLGRLDLTRSRLLTWLRDRMVRWFLDEGRLLGRLGSVWQFAFSPVRGGGE